jgi:hypothetical protein
MSVEEMRREADNEFDSDSSGRKGDKESNECIEVADLQI